MSALLRALCFGHQRLRRGASLAISDVPLQLLHVRGYQTAVDRLEVQRP